MKIRFKTTAALVAMFAAIGSSTSFAQTVTYNPGDLIIGFQATVPGSTGFSENFMLNVGSAAGYNNGAMPLSLTSPIANIGSQLTSVYGADWFSRGDLNWGAIGVRQKIAGIGSTGPIIDGDGRGVIYASREATGIGESDAWNAFSRTLAANVSGKVEATLLFPVEGGSFNGQDAVVGTNGLGAIVTASLDNSWSNQNKNGYSFTGFEGGIEGALSLSGLDLAYLDIYRVTPDGIAPTWVVTLALDSAGNVYAVPEPSTYAAVIGAAGLLLVIARRARRNKVAA